MKQQKNKLLLILVLGVASFTTPSLIFSHEGHSHDEKPFPGRGDKCVVEPTSKMRKNHFDYIRDQRDKTVHKGIRTKQFRLQRCVNCHADPKSNSVLGGNGFCLHCHKYTAVRIDCFSCHTDKAEKKSTTDKKSPKGAKQ
jgi:hypothetical protein